MGTSPIADKIVVITGASSGIAESTPIAPVEALKVEEWDRQIDVNIKGVLYGVAAVLPHMQKQKNGHIINVASGFGIKVFAPGASMNLTTIAKNSALFFLIAFAIGSFAK
jgi:NADP-dependent 3-hydroxy acid dehydrogenase YdfG